MARGVPPSEPRRSRLGPDALRLLCLGLLSYTFTLTGSLQGLRQLRAIIVNLCGSSAGNFLPGGGAAGVAVTDAAFRSWGSPGAISTSIIVTGVANIPARMILPVGALLPCSSPGATCLSPSSEAGSSRRPQALPCRPFSSLRSSAKGLPWAWPSTQPSAAPFASAIQVSARGGRRRVITDQPVRTVAVVRHGWLKMTCRLTAFFGIYYVLFWQIIQLIGLRMSFSHLFAAYARGRLLSAVGTTPGGVGVTEGERGCRPGRLRRRPGESPGRCRAPSRCSHTSWRSRWTRWPFSAGA